MNLQVIIVTFVVTFLAIYIYLLNSNISDLEDKNKSLSNSLKSITLESNLCTSTVESKNREIEKIAIDLNEKQKLLQEWKTKPIEVKYKTIYKTIVKDSNLTGECKDVKNLINSTTSINLNSL